MGNIDDISDEQFDSLITQAVKKLHKDEHFLCEHGDDRVIAYAEGALTGTEKDKIHDQIEECVSCFELYIQIKQEIRKSLKEHEII